MLLQKLREYADRLHDMAPPMYDWTPIRWIIDLDEQGRLLGSGFVSTASGVTAKKDRGRKYLAPYVMRAYAVRPKLLADTAEYVLGIARGESRPDRVAQCHTAFAEAVDTCAARTREPTVEAVSRFLSSLDPAKLDLPGDFDAGDILTFRVDGVLPIDLPSVRQYWASAAVSSSDDGDGKLAGHLMQCLICGRVRPAVERLQYKIKPIPNGQPAGLALISANEDAFLSYGLKASLIAPTCGDCGERFSKAANVLLSSKDSHIRIDPLVYLFWTREPADDFSLATMLSDPKADEVRALIASAFRGSRQGLASDANRFYATAFSASGARVVVRDWIDTTVGEVHRQVARYFATQRLVDTDGSEGKPYGIYTLAASTVRDAARDLPASVPRALLHMALEGGPLPMGLLFQVVKRNRAEQRITRPRAALIKMVLLSQHSGLIQEDRMVQLDPENTHPAYRCGRLLAVLEAVQASAIPGAKATITDRFFGTASSAPASVFGRLIRGSQAHLGKLRKERRGAYEALEKRLEEVLAGLPGFPKTLSLEDQGLFGLGYYHQRAADRAARLAHSQFREDERNGAVAASRE